MTTKSFSKEAEMGIFTAIGQDMARRYLLVILATTQSEAMWQAQKWMGIQGKILWIGQGSPNYTEAFGRLAGLRDIASTWVFDQAGKWWELG